ncbi:MAG: glycosyltransferase [Rhodothermales bacterium]
MKSHSHIALVELYAGGHHRMYLELLVQQWLSGAYPGKLSLWVSSVFAESHADFISALVDSPVEIHVLDEIPRDLESGSGAKHLLKCDRWHGHALKHACDGGAKHVVFMYLDHAQLAVARRSTMNVRVSGILFKPPERVHSWALPGVVRQVRKRFILNRLTRSPSLHTIFVLDPAIPVERPFVYMPDGITQPDPDLSPDEIRAQTGSGRARLFLMFGDLSLRKGIHRLADAWSGQGHLLLAGRVPENEPEAQAAVDRLANRQDVSYYSGYASNERMAAFFRASDVVLLPYDGHVGSSNVLIRAAHAGKPVIACSDGLVGRLVEQNELGRTVNPTDATAFGSALDRQEIAFNPSKMAQFSALHSPEAMGQIFFSTILTN